MHLSGWAVSQSASVTGIEVVHDAAVLRMTEVDVPRPDVSKRFTRVPEDLKCGFSTSVGLVGLGLECTLSLRAVLADGRRVGISAVQLERQALRSGFDAQVQPLHVTSLGRSGSTWMLRILKGHPEIVVHDLYPYEENSALYWLHMLKVLAEPTNLLQSSNSTFVDNPWWVGHNPYSGNVTDPVLREWFGRTYVERLAAFCQSSIEDWYLTLAKRQGTEEDGDSSVPTYFAQKVGPMHLHQELTWELYPRGKEIFLVRDFRDMMASILAFDERRGFFGFGRAEGSSDHDYVREMRWAAGRFYMSWLARRHRAHLVRYEDLVFRPRETVAGLLKYLELSSSDEVTEQMLVSGSGEEVVLPSRRSSAEVHRTTSELVASVGRWRNDMDESLQSCCQQVFGEFLENFGYPAEGVAVAEPEKLPVED